MKTWKIILLSLLIVGTLTVVAVIVQQNETPQSESAHTIHRLDASGQVTLPVDGVVRVGKDTTIQLAEITDDNRCPIDAQCGEAGAVSIHLVAQKGDHTEGVWMSSDQAPQRYQNHLISIVDVGPEKNSNQEISRDAYRVILHIISIDPEIMAELLAHEELIRVFSPQPGDQVQSPLRVIGEARGQWFFEANFPVMVTDRSGEIIYQHYATAEGEWMTTEFVPFAVDLVFTPPANVREGFILLAKSNASGLPEHDDQIKIPVRF